MPRLPSFLAGATIMAALLTAVFVLTGAREPLKHAHFDEITVGRINIVEPDGTKRLVISNKAQFPGDFFQGKEGERPDRRSFAGILFIDDEGTENGGLIQNGSMSAEGKIKASLSLTFDRFRQDQTLQLFHNDSDLDQNTGIMINDVPHYQKTALTDYDKFRQEANRLPVEKRDGYWKQLAEQGRLPQNRIYLGNTRDRGSSLILNDAQGRMRMMLLVSADGKPVINMYDELGKVIKSVTPEN